MCDTKNLYIYPVFLAMKKITSILFLALLVFSVAGYFLLFSLMRFYVRHTVELQDEKNVTVHQMELRHLADVKWIRYLKEFEINGELYDVTKIDIGGGVVRISYMEDREETALVNNFINNNSLLNRLLKRFVKLILEKYIPQEAQMNLFRSPVSVNFFDSSYQYFSPYGDVLSPPPKVRI